MTTGLIAALSAVRQLMLRDSSLSSAGVFFGSAPREDELPYLILSFSPIDIGHHLGPRETQRKYRLLVKVCSTPEGTIEANDLLLKAVLLLKAGADGEAPAALLSEYAEPMGWRVDVPIEKPEMQPYTDRLTSDVERWHFGNRFDLRLSPL